MRRLLLTICLCTAPLHAQTDPVPTLQLSTTVVSVPVVVHDDKGHLVHGLKAADFQLKEGRTTQEIRYFSEDNTLPLTLVLMVDTSGSTDPSRSKEAISSHLFFSTMLKSQSDRAALVQFDTNILQLHSLSNDPVALDGALTHLSERHPARADILATKKHDGTLLYDGLCSVSEDILAAEPAGRKAIVLLTDGDDNRSRLTLGQAVDCVQRANVAVYSIFFYSGSQSDTGWQALQTLSNATGGAAFDFADYDYSGFYSVANVYRQIANDLHSQYLLGYTPEDFRPGKYHTLTVKPLLSHLTVQARAGYYAPKHGELAPPVESPLPAAPHAPAPLTPASAKPPTARVSTLTPPPPAPPPLAPTNQAYDYWPNPVSHTNSDAWLREHHAEIALLKPRVLVIVADNHVGIPAVETFVKQAVAAAAEGSRYHGYSDPQAKPQLEYQIAALADLRDQANTPWPSIWPVHLDEKGLPRFDYDGLFSPEMAHALGIRDAADPNRFLNLHELFEQGLINEVWMVYPEIDGQPDNGIAGLFETVARVQRYGQDGNPILHDFERCAGNGCLPSTTHGRANVTMRFAELNIHLGVGCFTHATGHGWEGLWRAIPEFDLASARFFNRKLKQQGLPIDDLYVCPAERGVCWEFPNDHTLTNGPLTRNLPHFRDEHWGQGCGSVHFPPNGKDNYDFEDSHKVLSTCENYGLQNGPNGTDKQVFYHFTGKPQDPTQPWGCGAAWQIYLRQSFPGYGPQAKNADGSPMKSWWPYLYY